MSPIKSMKRIMLMYIICLISIYSTTNIMKTLDIEFTIDNLKSSYITIVSCWLVLCFISTLIKYYMLKDKGGGETDV